MVKLKGVYIGSHYFAFAVWLSIPDYCNVGCLEDNLAAGGRFKAAQDKTAIGTNMNKVTT